MPAAINRLERRERLLIPGQGFIVLAQFRVERAEVERRRRGARIVFAIKRQEALVGRAGVLQGDFRFAAPGKTLARLSSNTGTMGSLRIASLLPTISSARVR